MEQALYWLTGALGVPLVNWLKARYGLQGRAAMWLTTAVAALLGLAAALLSRELAPGSLQPEGLLAAFGQVLAAATLAYKLLAE
ncbi:MAG: hypothetical protein KF701_04890 [Anaerolineales bacterium]|nr:MAG: hypothetical protein KF701_04890 [Anaerolineales bacterium]